MNKFNKQGLQRLLLLSTIIISGVVVLSFISFFDIRVVVAVVFICGGFYVSWLNALHLSIQDTLLQSLGFSVGTDSTVLDNYAVGNSYRLFVFRVYQPTSNRYPFRLIRFKLTKGSGKHKIVRTYIGCEFITQQNHHSVRLFDRRDPFQPTFATDRQLESNEFNQLFNVYSDDPKAPFYFFDPDTMSDLIDLKNNTGRAINLESVQNQILIYVDAADLIKGLTVSFSWSEVLNGKVDPTKLGAYQQNVEQFLTQLQGIFATLDYKLKV